MELLKYQFWTLKGIEILSPKEFEGWCIVYFLWDAGKWGFIPVDCGNTCCISQELSVDRELGGIETLQRNAVDYHNVDNPFLMPLDAFFVKVHVFMRDQKLQYADLVPGASHLSASLRGREDGKPWQQGWNFFMSILDNDQLNLNPKPIEILEGKCRKGRGRGLHNLNSSLEVTLGAHTLVIPRHQMCDVPYVYY